MVEDDDDDPVETPKDAFRKQMFMMRLESERFAKMGAFADSIKKLNSVAGAIAPHEMASLSLATVAAGIAIHHPGTSKVISPALTAMAKDILSSVVKPLHSVVPPEMLDLMGGTTIRQAALERIWRLQYEQEQPIVALTTRSERQPCSSPDALPYTMGPVEDLPPSVFDTTSSNFALGGADRTISTGVFKRSGKVWQLTFAGKTIHHENLVGIERIAAVVAKPHFSFDAAQLAGTTIGEAQFVEAGIPAADSKTLKDVRAKMDAARVESEQEFRTTLLIFEESIR